MATGGERQYKLFISFAQADSTWVQNYLIPALGIPDDLIINPLKFHPGAGTVSEFEYAVCSSLYTILVLSPEYCADCWAKLSKELASHSDVAGYGTRLIPLVRKPCDIPLGIDYRVKLDFTDEASWKTETNRLRELLNQPAPTLENIDCPYPGMRPFEEESADLFFGRDQETDGLIYKLRHRNRLFLIGPSGSGKSSLLSAGLVHKLQTCQPAHWLIRSMRPGDAPLQNLERLLGERLPDHSLPTAQPNTFVKSILDRNAPAKELLLIVDQAEELFTQSEKDTRKSFITVLETILEVKEFSLIMAFRADFYQELMDSSLWELVCNDLVPITRLRDESLRNAITKPAQKCKVYLEERLADRLMADAADEPGVLPLIQETMVLLWGKRQERLITLSSYEAMAGNGSSGLVAALSNIADASFARLPKLGQSIARRIFLRLVQFGEGRRDTRRQQPVDALKNQEDDLEVFEATLQHLAGDRLLTLSADERNVRKADISHEALITGWARLQGWLRERRDAEQQRRRFEAKADEWIRLGRSTGGLLDGVEIQELDQWRDSPAATDLGISENLHALARASRHALEELRRREQRQQRLENEVAAKDEQVDQQRRLAVSREVAAAALDKLYSDPELGLLLAIEAMELAHTFEAEDSLRRALQSSHLYRILNGHENIVNSASFSPDGHLVVTASQDGTVRLWDSSTGQARGPVWKHGGNVSLAVFSSDGRLVLSGSEDCTARIWEVPSEKEVAVLRGHTDNITQVCFLPGDRQVVTASDDRTARIWSTATGQEIRKIYGPDDQIDFSAFSADGQLIVVATQTGPVTILDVIKGQELARLQVNRGQIRDAVFSLDNRVLIVSSRNDEVQVWQIDSGQKMAAFYEPDVRRLTISPHEQKFAMVTGLGPVWTRGKFMLKGHNGQVNSAAFSSDGQQILTAGDDWTARVWDAVSGQQLALLQGHEDKVTSAEYSPNGQWVVTASWDHTARIWQVAAGRELAVLCGHEKGVRALALDGTGNRALTDSYDGTVRIWDTVTGHEVASLPNVGMSRCVAFNLAGERVATVSQQEGKVVSIWSTLPPQKLMDLRGHTDNINSVASSHDGKYLVTASWDHTVRVWDAVTGECLRILSEHTEEVNSAAFSPDDRLIVAPTWGRVRVWEWDLSAHHEVICLKDSMVEKASFSSSGRTLMTASDSAVGIWDTESWQKISVLRTGGKIRSATFCPDETMAIVSNDYHTAELWTVAPAKAIMTLRGHAGAVNSVLFSPNGNLLVTASDDGTARLWEMPSGQKVAILRGHQGPVLFARFSLDGQQVITSGDDGTVRIYAISKKDLMQIARQRVSRSLSKHEQELYLSEKRHLAEE